MNNTVRNARCVCPSETFSLSEGQAPGFHEILAGYLVGGTVEEYPLVQPPVIQRKTFGLLFGTAHHGGESSVSYCRSVHPLGCGSVLFQHKSDFTFGKSEGFFFLNRVNLHRAKTDAAQTDGTSILAFPLVPSNYTMTYVACQGNGRRI